jgi:glutamyl-tRNA synthetase
MYIFGINLDYGKMISLTFIKTIRMIYTRFAPSPTGLLHIGGARTALFSWIFAKQNNGNCLLRIEDTDTLRSNQESVNNILEALNWLGIKFTQPPIYQTQRIKRYQERITQLLDNNLAYYCYCSKERLEQMRDEQLKAGIKPKYDQYCLHNHQQRLNDKPAVIRFKNPIHGSVGWHDLIKGDIVIDNSELDDLIIARSDGTPTYNFCVVVDDLDMQISHVIRGDDHINNTPRQINLIQALGGKLPHYAHVPMILSADGVKMSKRKDTVSVLQYRKMGILPEALINYLSRLCWAHGNDEIFSIQQLIEWFTLEKVSPAAARFDVTKLLWVNAQHIKQSTNDNLAKLVKEYWLENNMNNLVNQVEDSAHKHLTLNKVIELVKQRADTINKLAFECSYFFSQLPLEQTLINEFFSPSALKLIQEFGEQLLVINNWTLADIKILINDFCNNKQIKTAELAIPLRLKLCGYKNTPAIEQLLYTIGIDEITRRMAQDICTLQS